MGNDVKTVKEILHEINAQISTPEAIGIVETFYESLLIASDDVIQPKGLLIDSYQLKKLLVELFKVSKKEYNFRY